MERLFVYGTLRPGHSNAHIMDNIGGEWQPAMCRVCFMNAAGERRRIFPGVVLCQQPGLGFDGYLFPVHKLSAHWPMLDAFEEGYDRVAVDVTMEDGQRVTAWIYQLQPKVAA